MSNLMIIIIFLLLITSFLAICYNYNSQAINVYLTIVTLVAYLLSFRNINLLGMNINANTLIYSIIFPLILLYFEKNRIKDTKTLISKNNTTLIITIFLLMLITGYIPSVNDTNAINIHNTLGNNFRILIGYPLTLILSEYIMMYFYFKLEKIYPNKFLTIIISLSITTTLDIVIYNLIVNSFKMTFPEILYIMAITYIIRIVIIIISAFIINNFLPKKKVKK